MFRKVLFFCIFFFAVASLKIKAATSENEYDENAEIVQKISDLIVTEEAGRAIQLWNTLTEDQQNGTIATVILNSYSSSHQIFDSLLKFIFVDKTIATEGFAAKELFNIMLKAGEIAGENIFPLAFKINERVKSLSTNETIGESLENHLWVLSQLPDPVQRIIVKASTKLRNKARGGYMYASDFKYKGEDDRRLIFRWNRPGPAVTYSDWDIRSIDGLGRVHRLFNTGRGEYLYAADNGHAYDDMRRSVLCWMPGNPVSDGNWSFILNQDNTIQVYNVRPATEYLYADSLNYDDDDNTDRGYIFTNRYSDVFPTSGGDWYTS